MASAELTKYINDIYGMIEKTGKIEYEELSALYQATNVAMFTENDTEYGLKTINKTKLLINDLIKQDTHGEYNLWGVENICSKREQDTREIELYYDLLLFESFYNFQSFIFYLERLRKPEARFYYPRRKTLKIVVDDLSNLEDRKFEFYGLSMPARVGKLLSNVTPVLTKNGWKNHGDLVVGDYVLGRNMEWVKVTHIHPKNFANKRVWFADNTYIDCHENHEWLVYDRSRNCERIVETKALEKSEYHDGSNRRYRYLLPICDVDDGEDIELPIHPYALGVWLGDGTNRKPLLTICDGDEAIVDSVKEFGYEVTNVHEQVGCKCYSFVGLRDDLQKLGMCHSRKTTQKHIPSIFLTASKRQRLELLAGLIDTDGCLRDKENRYDISTSDEVLRDDIVSLVNSLGWRVCVSECAPCMSTGGIEGKKVNYRISFNPCCQIPCRVERKRINKFSEQRRIAIERVEDIEPTEGNCITVEGGLYRAGRTLKLTHNSTTCILFLNWIMLKRPNSHNAMGGHSGELAKGFYKETKNLLTSKEYTFREMYEFWHPTSALIRETSAEGMSIILDKPDRFGTLVCRGIDGCWTGAVDISSDGYLYVDDLVKNREMSLSPQRMADCYQTYLNTMVDRKNDGARELMVGTLWNVTDPLERERVKHEGDPRYFFRRIPALNQNGRSNFDYELNGFSTQYYINLKNRLADAEWQAKYMQKPYVREGLLFDKNELRYFDGIIDSVINSDSSFRTVAVLDPAFGGGDSLSMPICRDYGDCNKFIIDWVFSNRTQKFTVPIIVKKIMQHGIAELQIETNSAGKLMVDSIGDEMKRQGCNFCKLTPVSAPVRMSKEDKIKGYSDYIKDNFVFLLPKDGKKVPTEAFIRSQDYEKAMDELGSYTSVGKNPHDDAPDSMAQMAMFFEKTRNGKIEIPINPFRIGRMR